MIRLSNRDFDPKLIQTWNKILSRFPKEFQAEIADERGPNKAQSQDNLTRDIKIVSSFKLKNNKPIKRSLEELVKTNQDILSLIPQQALDKINKQYGTNTQEEQVEGNEISTEKLDEYSKMPAKTAKPSTLVNGKIEWGNHRFVAALLRGDKDILVWDVESPLHKDTGSGAWSGDDGEPIYS